MSFLPGATITGMGRRLSTLRTREVIRDNFATRAPDYAVFNFGQVDVELGYYFRQVVKDETPPFEAFAETIIQQYMLSLKEIVGTNIKVIIKGINPPVLIGDHTSAVHYTSRIITENIDDPAETERLTAKLYDTYPGDRERTERHQLFNKLLRAHSSEHGFRYFDLMDRLIDQATGLTDLRNVPAFDDHHVSDDVWMRQHYWRPLIDFMNGPDAQPKKNWLKEWLTELWP